MMIITECPKCKSDFMYDPNNDNHLRIGNMPVNCGDLGLSEEDLKQHDIDIIICQRCSEDMYVANILEEFVSLAENNNPEFQEEHTTGWDLIQNAKKQIKRIRDVV